jgi:type IV fimbrial biogenesis protein FimT
MFQLSPSRAAQRGFTVTELMIGVAVLGFMLALGVPSMGHWMTANKARSASEFYGEGFVMARRQAVNHNARSRLVLTPNATNGQMDWQVDICFSTAAVQCDDDSGVWSTTTAIAAGDPEGAARGFKSVFRSADRLPSTDVLTPSLLPAGTSKVYFTEVGWVDTTFGDRLTRIRLDPGSRFQNEVPTVALVITLAGLASKCDPTKTGTDSRACPP